ncbi:MAG: PAS domain S-box protein [Cyclobacteriaceae bacterium]
MDTLSKKLLVALESSSSIYCILNHEGAVLQKNQRFDHFRQRLGLEGNDPDNLLIAARDNIYFGQQFGSPLELAFSGQTYDNHQIFDFDDRSFSYHLVLKPFFVNDQIESVLVMINDWQENVSKYRQSLPEVWTGWRKNLHYIIEQAPIPMTIVAEDGEFLFINDTFLQNTGYDRSEVSNLENWAKMAYGEHKEQQLARIKSVFTANKIVEVGELEIFGKNKVRHIWHLFSTPLGKTSDGRKILLNMSIDITSHKEKEKLLERERKELAALTEQLPQLLYTAEPSGKISYVNINWLEFTGKSLQEVREKMWFFLVHPQDRERVEEKRRKTLRLGEFYEDEFRFKRKDGEYRWVFVRSLPIKNDKGQVIKWIGTATDIHENKEANKPIEEKANEFYYLAETIDHHVWVSDAQGNILYLNKTWYQYTGLDKTTIANNQNWFKIFHPSELDNLIKIENKARQKGKEYHLEVKLKRHDGEYRWFLTHATPVKNAEGKLIKWIGTNTDIHDQKIKTEQLQSEVLHLKELIESIPQLAWTANPAGDIDYYNKEWYLFTGADEANFYGWNLTDFIHDDDREAFDTIVKQKMQNNEGFHLQVRFRKHIDNNYYWHIIQQRPVREGNGQKIKFWIGTATNIHEQKMLEQQKGAFMNIASHELKTPITSLSGFLQMSKEMCQDSNPAAAGLLQKATNSVTNLRNLIEELLDVSRIENGKGFDFEKEPIDFDEFVGESVSDAESLYNIKIKLSGQTNATISGNKFRLAQIIDNLISNALKYSQIKSPIIIKIGKEDSSVVLKVQDHGIGIPKEKLNRIFDRFYRVTDTGFTSGLGIGLYLCKTFVEKHEGNIWAESEEGKGTTFYVKLPAIN